MKNHSESGYFLITMLVFILSVGVGWFAVVSTVTHDGTAPNAISEHDRRGLVNARQSMLSYAALYPYLYGPSGAGPAHLPCPDTDGYRKSVLEQQSAKNQRRDGPNPPCASLTRSDGQLPRHIALPGYRYLFHSQSTQRYDYSVAGSVVNNPLNRVVNLEQLSAQAQRPVAIIRLPSSVEVKPAAQVTITGMALADAAVSSAAAWVVDRASRFSKEQCRFQPGEALASQQTSDSPCVAPESMSLQCEGDKLLALVLDLPIVSKDDCLVNTLDSNTIDGVPALRHWFVRNAWYTSFETTIQDDCVTSQPLFLSCVLSLTNQSLRVAIASGSPVELQWIGSL